MDEKRVFVGKRVRILGGACDGMYGVVELAEDDRQVATVLLDQPCKYKTTEEDYDNLELSK